MLNLDDLYEWLNSLENNDNHVECIDTAVLVYKEAKVAIDELAVPYENLQKDAKTIIQNIIDQTGETKWNKETGLQNGNAYIPAPYSRVSYDTDLLDKYMEECTPEVRTILKMARKETTVKPSLTIK